MIFTDNKTHNNAQMNLVMNTISNIAAKIAFILTLTFIAFFVVTPSTTNAAVEVTPNTARRMSANGVIIRRAIVANNVVSSATEPVMVNSKTQDNKNEISSATEPNNMVSSATEPTVGGKVRSSGPRLTVTIR